MADARAVNDWIEGYVAAWNSNDPDEIGALFTADAEYWTDPYGQPWRGSAEIVRQWLAHKDEPGETTFAWHPVVFAADVAVVQGVTTYPNTTYSNLWVIKLDEAGRCRHFTEWWMEQPAEAR